jgi:hypothetical protein
MEHPTPSTIRGIAPSLLAIALLLLIALAPASAQQKDVRQFDSYVGYAFLDSPAISLFENGFQTQFGYRYRTWLSLGVDYSYSRGDLTVTPDLLPTALQQQLAAQLAGLAAAGLIPAGYQLRVPASSTTQSLAAGPQFAYRHFQKITLFARPSFGAIWETATPNPTDPIATLVLAGLKAQGLIPSSGKKQDVQGFYGFGYGVDFLFNKNFGWRVQGDLVWDHLFNDILRNGRWTTRFSTGPCFNFGRNIVEK